MLLYIFRAWQGRKAQWLLLAAASGLLAYTLGFYLLKINWQWFGFALYLPAGALMLAVLGLRHGSRVPEELRSISQTFTGAAYLMLVAGLAFSWPNDFIRLGHSLTLTVLATICVVTSRSPGWLYGLLGAVHLAYLTFCSILVGGWANLSPVQTGLVLLPVGLALATLAVWLGRRNNESLGLIFTRGVALNQDRSFPFYLAAGIDLVFSVGLTLNHHPAGLVVAGLVAVSLLLIGLGEESEELAWAGYAIAGLALYHIYSWTNPGLLVVIISLGSLAIALTVLAYMRWQGRSSVLSRPAYFTAHLLLILAFGLWLVDLGKAGTGPANWDTFSWLVGLAGLNYLLLSALEGWRNPAGSENLRFLGYASVLLLQLAFIIRLLLVNATQPQLYILPVGLGCLVIGWLERANANRRAAILLEGLGLVLVLGTSLLQTMSLQTAGIDKGWYGMLLLVEGLMAVGFGAGNRLRYYFFGGIAALLLDLLALLADPVRAANMWVTLGLTGLVLIATALFLERKRELVLQVSKDWLNRLKQWD
jgi:hypothetical protein